MENNELLIRFAIDNGLKLININANFLKTQNEFIKSINTKSNVIERWKETAVPLNIAIEMLQMLFCIWVMIKCINKSREIIRRTELFDEVNKIGKN